MIVVGFILDIHNTYSIDLDAIDLALNMEATQDRDQHVLYELKKMRLIDFSCVFEKKKISFTTESAKKIFHHFWQNKISVEKILILKKMY